MTPVVTRFLVIGINHRGADVAQREAFALSKSHQQALLREAKAAGLAGALVIATCNRTELYGRTDCPQPVADLLLRYTRGSGADFQVLGFVKHGRDALMHLFRVASGLDSLVLGDVQIAQQVKEAYRQAQAEDATDSFLHKALQQVLKAHKRARRETAIGSGAASVSHAAVQCIRRTGRDLGEQRVLVVGAGKIGKVTLRNLLGLGAEQVTLVNRSRPRAEGLAEGLSVRVADWERLSDEVDRADVVIVATGAPEPVVLLGHIVHRDKRRLFVDLSVPRNIDPAVGTLPHQQLINMDNLATVVDQAARQREAARPAVEAILAEELGVFEQWLQEQRITPVIKALNAKLEALKAAELEAAGGRLSPEMQAEVARVAHRLMAKLLAQHLQALRSANGSTDDLVDAVRRLYDLTPESLE